MSKELQELHNIIAVLMQKIDSLTPENTELKKRLSKYEIPKNSRNNSIPPSKDENRPKRKSLREKSTRKVGGQKDHKGKTLKMIDNPDVIQKHKPDYCNLTVMFYFVKF